MTRQITAILSATACAAFIALFTLATTADAHRNGSGNSYINQYLRLICEEAANTRSTDADPRMPEVHVGEVCRVRSTYIVIPEDLGSPILEPAGNSAHYSNLNSVHGTRGDSFTPIVHQRITHDEPRYRWVIEPTGDDGTCTGNPATPGTKNIPSGGNYNDVVTAAEGFFAAAGTNRTYTVAAEDEGKCIYALVHFSSATKQANAGGRVFHHATINPRNNFGTPPAGSEAFNANVIVQPAPDNTTATGAPTVTPTTPATAPTEDNQLTASTDGITEPNRINASTVMWQWQSADAPETGTPADGDYTAISGATESTFTPGDDEAGRYVRVCVSFMDMHLIPRAEGPLCNAPAAAVININDVPVAGAVSTADNVDLSTDGPNEDEALSIAAPTDADGISNDIGWQWQQADPDGTDPTMPGTFGDIGSAITSAPADAATFTPLQVHVGKFLRACASYTDDQGTMETDVCTGPAHAVANVNDAPVPGAITAADGADLATAGPNEDMALTAADPVDEDGISMSIGWQWQQADPDGTDPTMPGAFGDITDNADAATFTPEQAQVGKFLRACASYEDDGGTTETEVCTALGFVTVNVNDAPVATDNTIMVPIDRTHTFAADDFTFTDEDMDERASVIIVSLPPADQGRLLKDGAAITPPDTIAVADIGGLVYHPRSGATDSDSTSFTFKVADDGSDGSGDRESVDAATITIDLAAAANTAPTPPTASFADGNPGPTLGSPITVDSPRDVDGIPTSGAGALAWQWNSAATVDGNYAAISSATAATYSPADADVGRFLQACASYTDGGGVDEHACWTASASVNARPTGRIVITTDGASAAALVLTPGTEYRPGIDSGGGDLMDANGFSTMDATTLASWQRSEDGGTSLASETLLSYDGDGPGYTPAAGLSGHLRLCLFYADDDGHAEGGMSDSSDNRFASGTVCSDYVPFNSPATGMVTVSDGMGTDFAASGPTERRAITADASGLSDPDGPASPAFRWQWRIADGTGDPPMSNGTYADIGGATAARYTPVDADVGRFLQVCASFTDGLGTDERACHSFVHPVINTNTVATGTPVLSSTPCGRIGGSTMTSPATGATEDQCVFASLSTNGGTVVDPEIRGTSPRFETHWRQSIQRSTEASGQPWVESHTSFFETTAVSKTYGYPVGDADARAGHLRACVFFDDRHGTAEGGDATDENTRVTDPTLCSTPIQVTNINDAPTAAASDVNALLNGTRSFAADDFDFSDPDGDGLASVIIETLPTAGTLAEGGTALTGQTTIAAANIGNLAYTPADGAMPGDTATFTFNVVDDGDNGSGDKTSLTAATMTITLIRAPNQAATGVPILTYETGVTAATQGSPIGADLSQIMDGNGISDRSAISVRWQRDQLGTFINVGNPGPSHTPTNDDSGRALRACASFTDDDGHSEGPLCSAASDPVIDVNDAPTGTITISQISCTDPADRISTVAADLSTVAKHACIATSVTTEGASLMDNLDGLTGFGNRSWQQSIQTSTAASGADWTEVYEVTLRLDSSPTARYRVTQADVDAGFLRSCIFYTDDRSHAEGGTADSAATRASTASICSAAIPVTFANDVPAGAPAFTDRDGAVVTSLTEDTAYSITVTSNGGDVIDLDGFVDSRATADPATHDHYIADYSFQRGVTVSGATTWTERHYVARDVPETSPTRRGFTIEQADVNAGMIRVCMFYTDAQSTAEGGDNTNAATRVGGTLCSAPVPVRNTNDAPIASDYDISLQDTATHTFSAADFPFTDADRDALASVIIETVPAAGTLANGGTALTGQTTIAAADIGNLIYTPADGAMPGDTATFTFKVVDDGDGPAGDADADKTSTNTATVTINIVVTPNRPATGAPVLVLWNNGSPGVTPVTHILINTQYAFTAGTIADPDGVNTAAAQSWTRSWQISGDGVTWRESVTNTRIFRIVRAESNIRQARLCVFFNDRRGHAEGGNRFNKAGREAGTLCSVALPVSSGVVSLAYGGHAVPTLGTAVTASINDPGGTTTSTPTWVWERSDSLLTPRTAIAGATAASYTPVTADIGKFLHATATYTDDAGVDKEEEGASLARVNAPPTGSIVMHTSGGSVPGLTSFTVNIRYYPGVTTAGGNLADANGGLSVDADGVHTNPSIRFSWQRSEDDGATWTETAELPTRDTGSPSYIPDAADGTAGHLRVCMFYTDDDGHVEGGAHDTPAERAAGTICSAALPVNAAPTGVPTISCAATPMEDGACTADGRDIADADVVGTLTWQWWAGTPAAAPDAADAGMATFAEIASATDAAFTPDQEQVGHFLRACARFTDGGGTSEGPLCATSAVVVANVNDPVGGEVTLGYAASITAATEDSPITAGSAAITDEDGITTSQFNWQWSQDNGGDGAFSPIADADAAGFTPLQANVGNVLRVCASFTDDQGGAETLCADTAAVVNVSDAPVAGTGIASVFNNADAAEPLVFTAAHFPFTDEDMPADNLVNVIIAAAPRPGTLLLEGRAPSYPATVTTQDLMDGDLTYHPAANADVQSGYATITFKVTDSGADGGSNVSTEDGTLTINLVSRGLIAASGAPTVTAATGTAYAEDNELTASTEGIMEPNGIQQSTLAWQWQQAAADSDSNAPAADSSEWSDIAGASATATATTTFTPLQEHVGQYIRVQVHFTDNATTEDGMARPTPEGPLYSVPGRVTNVNDAPTGRPALALVDSDGTILDGNVTSLREGDIVAAFHNRGGGSVYDEDGVPEEFYYSLQSIVGQTKTQVASGDRVEQLMTADLYEVTQDDASGNLRVCVSYIDGQGRAEGFDRNNPASLFDIDGPLCSPQYMVEAINEAATGAPTLSYADGNTAATEDSPITADADAIMDGDNSPPDSIGQVAWQWSQDAAGDGNFVAIAGATAATFTPLQANVGNALQVCASFTDALGGDEQVCATSAAVANANDAPVATAATVLVLASATSASGAHTFSAADFPFTDEDGDALISVTITSLPTAGILAQNGNALTAVPADAIAVADLGTLTWYPAAGLTDAANGYATIGYRLTDDGDDGTGNTTSAEATLTIDLAPTGQVTASGAPTVAATDAAMTAHNEDVQLTASTTGITEPNGLDPASLAWAWQQAAAPETGQPAVADYTAIAEATEATFTPLQEHVGMYIRVCATFDDLHADADTAGAAGLCSTGTIITNTNDAATGEIALTYAQDVTVATEDSPITADGSAIADEDGITNIAIAWQWAAAATADGTFTDIASADAAAFTPLQAQVGQFLRVCADFADDTGNAEQVCAISDAVANVNDPPSGRPGIVILQQVPLQGVTTIPVMVANPTEIAEGDWVGTAFTDHSGTVMDEDGTSGVAWRYSLQSSTAASGAPWEEPSILHSSGLGSQMTPHRLRISQSTANAGWLRACVFYIDGQGTQEGGPAMTAEQRTSDAATLCSEPLPVRNVNDAPQARDHQVYVLASTTAENALVFTAAHFPFTDEDEDGLESISIAAAPTAGTLQLDGVDSIYPLRVTAMQLADGDLTWFPAPGQTDAMPGYATFAYRLTDDGDGPAGDAAADKTSAEATITINLTTGGPVTASGAPTVAPAATASGYDEDAELTATTTGITEPNGIDASTLQWQWQAAAASDGDYSDIAGATAATFTPLQAHVGQHIRVCVRFDDLLEDADSAGAAGLCSAAAQVRNVNDAPQATDGAVNVFTTADAATPFTFSIGDFDHSDEDGDELHSITLVTLPQTGNFNLGDRTAFTGRPILAADIASLSYYPLAGAQVQQDYASFTFTVNDDGQASSDPASMAIHLVPPGQIPATGAPAITGTAEQNATLTAGRGSVDDLNGVDETSIAWQWQQAAADGTFAPIAGATDATFTPTQAQVGRVVRVCMMFRDEHIDAATGTAMPGDETRCSTATAAIENVNDGPQAAAINYRATRAAGSDTVTIAAAEFVAAFSDIDGTGDRLQAVTIVTVPAEAHGTLAFAGTAVTVGQMLGVTADGDFDGGALTFAPAPGLQASSFTFSLTDSGTPALSSDPNTFQMTFGRDIQEEQVKQVGAVLSVAAVTNATNAIGGAISGAVGGDIGGAGGTIPTGPGFDISMGGTSLVGMGRSLYRNLGVAAAATGMDNTDLPQTIATEDQRAWYLGTADNWEYIAAGNAGDNSAASILNRLNAIARGDIALNYRLTDTGTMRFWARYQSLDINGNEDEPLKYDGSGSGFYLGADNQITDTMRIGLAIGTDNSDITLDLDEDGQNDDATRSATSFYPYLHIDLGGNNQARVIAGFGSGTLDIRSTANTANASADLSWNMLAASISHHKALNDGIFADWLGDLADNLRARFDGSLQLGNSSTAETTFTNGSTLMAGKSSASELSINAELRYQSNNITPFASIATRKLMGDLSQAMALDMAFGADLQTDPANLRFAITRQINATTHQRHSISIDASTTPNALGITASLGSSYDSITGRPQWQSTIGWQRKRFQTSLQVGPGTYRLQARLRW